MERISGKFLGRTIVCLCGSTRFHDAYVEQNMLETRKGNIVLSCGVFGHTIHDFLNLDEDDKRKLDKLHKDKIALANEILVLDVGGYIGESTKAEIEYAKYAGKTIRFLVSPKLIAPCPKCFEQNRLELTTSGNNGEWGWSSYEGNCEHCDSWYRGIVDDYAGGVKRSLVLQIDE